MRELSDHQMNCVLACIFGEENSERTLDFYDKGTKVDVNVGLFYRKLNHQTTWRSIKAFRFLFSIFDRMHIGSAEKECERNSLRLRRFFNDLIQERKVDMQKSGYVPKEDFLSMLLDDDLFKGKDDTIIDECMTFMSAGT
ncbi:MAG: hypothetical protein ACMG6E_09220 [Candidatus Roizmanbacteria bacterium]